MKEKKRVNGDVKFGQKMPKKYIAYLFLVLSILSVFLFLNAGYQPVVQYDNWLVSAYLPLLRNLILVLVISWKAQYHLMLSGQRNIQHNMYVYDNVTLSKVQHSFDISQCLKYKNNIKSVFLGAKLIVTQILLKKQLLTM